MLSKEELKEFERGIRDAFRLDEKKCLKVKNREKKRGEKNDRKPCGVSVLGG